MPQNFVDSEDGKKKNRLKFLKDNKDNICWNTVMDNTEEEKDFLNRQVELSNNSSKETSEKLISDWYDNFKSKSSKLFSGYEIKSPEGLTGDEALKQTRIYENHQILVDNYNGWITGDDRLNFSDLGRQMILGFDKRTKYGVNYLINFLRESVKKYVKTDFLSNSGDRENMKSVINLNENDAIKHACAAGLYQYVIMFRLLGAAINFNKDNALKYAIHGDSPECIVALLENKRLGNTLESAFKTTVRHYKFTKNFGNRWNDLNETIREDQKNKSSSHANSVMAWFGQMFMLFFGWEFRLIGTSIGILRFLFNMIGNRLTSEESIISKDKIEDAKNYLTENFHQEGVSSIYPDWGLKNYYIILQLLTMYGTIKIDDNSTKYSQRNIQTLNTTQTAPAPAGGASRRHRVRRNNTHKIRPNKTRKASRPSRNKTRKAK